MKIAVFSTKSYDRQFIEEANKNHGHDITFFEPHLSIETCLLAQGFSAVCVFVNDVLNEGVLKNLADNGIKLIALRCAGFNNVDISVANSLGLTVVRVPEYSPYAVAEHAVALMLTLNRKIYRAYNRVRDCNFTLDGLLGFDMNGKTVGIIGTGKIGVVVAKIIKGFGCNVIAYDPYPNNQQCKDLGVKYVSLAEIFTNSDIITLHCPLTKDTYHLIDQKALEQMKDGVMIINTSRGALTDTQELISALKSNKIGNLGLDVYEEEADMFFEDLSGKVIQDDIFTRLLTFPNVLITSHQAFFTQNAMKNIADTTLENISNFEQNKNIENIVKK